MQETSATSKQDFKIGISDRVNTALPIWMAQHAGLFEREGLAVAIRYTTGGSFGARALRNGDIDLMRVGFSSVLRMNKEGGDLKCIASMSNVMRFTFFSATDVRSAADLKGGRIGVSAFGSESDTTVSFALRQLGMRRDDVRIEECGDAQQRLAALLTNEIQASAINEPVATEARKRGLNVMLDLEAGDSPWLFSGVVVRSADLLERREKLLRFLRAMIEGNYLAITDERWANVVLASELGLSDAAAVAESYEDFRRRSPLDMRASLQGARNVFAEVYPGLDNTAENDVDNSLIDELEKQGVLQSLRRHYGLPAAGDMSEISGEKR